MLPSNLLVASSSSGLDALDAGEEGLLSGDFLLRPISVRREDASDSTRRAFDANVSSGVSGLILDDAFRYAKRGYKLDKRLIATRKKGYQSSISHLMILLLLPCKFPPSVISNLKPQPHGLA